MNAWRSTLVSNGLNYASISQRNNKEKGIVAFFVLLIMMAGCVSPSGVFGKQVLSSDVPVPADIVFVLDNSGSMKKHDPSFLVRVALEQVATGAAEDTRIAMVIFDEGVDLVTPLTFRAGGSGWPGLANLGQLNYQGIMTNVSGGVERALQELTRNGRNEAVKSIVLLTDGVSDVGDKAWDAESPRRLLAELRSLSGGTKVSIYAIALTDTADFHLLRALAIETDGEYFYAEHAEEVPPIFARIYREVRKEQSIVSGQAPGVIASEGREARTGRGSPPTSLPESGAPNSAVSNGPSLYSAGGWLSAVGAALLLVGVFIAWILVHRRQPWLATFGPMMAPVVSGRASQEVQGYLYDMERVTSRKRYRLSNRVTFIGRSSPRFAKRAVGSIVIDKPTISRRHAIIEFRDDGFWVKDQESRNGTFVNGERVIGETRLRHGDRLRFHDWGFEFELVGFEDDYETVMVGHRPWSRDITRY